MLGVCALVIPLVISACSPSTSTPTPNAPMVTTVPMATDTPQMMQDTVTATPTSLDPCVLIDSQEASAFTGATYGDGEESTTSGGGRICTYGANTTNVFMVEVAQAPDVATAQSYKAAFLADLQANLQKLTSEGMNITQLPNFADGAVMADASLTVNGSTINGRAMGVLKGTIFFGFSDIVLGGPAPTSDAAQTEAQTLLGRLP
jgi:hypothetical protein